MLPFKRLCCRNQAVNSIGVILETYLKLFKSCKVRSLMCAADQHMGLIYFGYYQEKKEKN